MARMNIESRAARAAASGVAAALYLSVTDDAGKPIVDLQPGDFSVRAISSAAVALKEVTSRGEGIYVAEIVPAVAGATWAPGEYVLAVSVRRVFDRGQGLAVLAIS
jgi:hypothetical protein